MRRKVDWSLYLVTDRPLMGGRPIEEVVLAAVRGGATVVQLREKECETREFVALARRLKAALAAFDVPLIVNDRVDVALAAGADGVHVGQSDMEWRDVRRLVGPDMLVGLSVESAGQALEAGAFDVDCLGIGPIFATPTKPDAGAAIGLEALRQVRGRVPQALVAIGGIHAGNAGDVIAAGADGVAVVSALCAAPDPEQAARELGARIAAARR